MGNRVEPGAHETSGALRTAADDMLPVVYEDLRRLAASYLRREKPDPLLQTTMIVHEAYLRLVEQAGIHWRDPAHFVGLVARLMRQLLVEHARERGALKRGGGQQRVSLAEVENVAGDRAVDLVALDDALDDLARLDPRKAKIVELHFFGGLSFKEIAACLGVCRATVVREMQRARAWLFRQLDSGGNGGTVSLLAGRSRVRGGSGAPAG